MKFSVLLSVYYKEQPIYFDLAVKSIWENQTIKPSEIILVQDGPLTSELYALIAIWQKKIGNVFRCIPLETNVGLGDALNIGLQHCSYDLIARMDTDDIADPKRFEKQLAIFEQANIDICGSWVTEFDQDEGFITGVRKLPETHNEILEYAKLRCPINHPAVMYKKSVVEKAGGYQAMMWFEDYYLWARMLMVGAKFYNIQESLVNMRAGIGQLERRSGLEYAKAEINFLTALNSIGFLSKIDLYKMILLRVPIRLLPKKIIRFVYKKLRK